MPKAFTDDEREAIRARLRLAARELVPTLGVRRTRVSELARAAGISKGAFYLFYASKEALLVEVLLEDEAAARAEVTATLDGVDRQEAIATLVHLWFSAVQRYPVLQVLAQPGEMDALLGVLPPETLAEALADDDRFFLGLLAPLQAEGWLDGVDLATVVRLPRVAFALHQSRALVGEDRFEAVSALLAESLALRLARRSPDDAEQTP
ncbi:MAG: TetR/AcrR family transcriptional regulator [Alphaproteobacteria bacterium]|nr:TetR/AcrR family transcriptional regulator [Alphaproteobacteria bacterium]